MAAGEGGFRHWGGEIPPHVEEFIDWFVDPANAPHNQSQWARDHNVDRLTVNRWLKRKDVLRAIDERCNELNMRPDRIQNVMNAIYRAAEQGDMKAAQLYLQHVDRLAPKRIAIEDRRIESMSDEELTAELREHGLLEN